MGTERNVSPSGLGALDARRIRGSVKNTAMVEARKRHGV